MPWWWLSRSSGPWRQDSHQPAVCTSAWTAIFPWPRGRDREARASSSADDPQSSPADDAGRRARGYLGRREDAGIRARSAASAGPVPRGRGARRPVRGRGRRSSSTTWTRRGTTGRSRSRRACVALSAPRVPPPRPADRSRDLRRSRCWLRRFLDGFLTKNSTAPFVALILLLYSIGRYADARRFRLALAVLIPSLMVDPDRRGRPGGVGGPLLGVLPVRPPGAGGARPAQPRAAAGRAAREGGAGRARAGHERSQGRRGRARADRRRAPGAGRERTQRDGRPGRGRAARARRRGQRPSRHRASPRSRRRAATRSPRCARLLGVLRRDGDGLELAPQPGLGAGCERSWSAAASAAST